MTAFSRLTLREKWLLIAGGGGLLLLCLWLYIWQPVNDQRALQQDRIARYLSLIDIAGQTQDVTRPDLATCNDTSALGPRITRSAEASDIPLARLDPEGPRLRITVSNTGYAGAMSWISELEATTCTKVVAVEMVRLAEPGKISLRMTLEDAE
ncbi:MAG: type II secretion system protein GspM [Pelagibaca sp.]